VEIARALVAQPRFLLLDEPAAGMNDAETERLRDDIRTIRDRGVTVFLVEHDMALVMSVSDHVVVFNFGQKLAEGTAAEVQRNPAVIASYLGA
jgi:branched-chain amino acid transport system ATP-binding protein